MKYPPKPKVLEGEVRDEWDEIFRQLSDPELRTFIALYHSVTDGEKAISNTELARWDNCSVNAIHQRLCRIRKKVPRLKEILLGGLKV